MRLLDLFCGAGGAAMGYHRAGFDEIVGVDIKPHYGLLFIHAETGRYLEAQWQDGCLARLRGMWIRAVGSAAWRSATEQALLSVRTALCLSDRRPSQRTESSTVAWRAFQDEDGLCRGLALQGRPAGWNAEPRRLCL
jgi:hypothetical protein